MSKSEMKPRELFIVKRNGGLKVYNLSFETMGTPLADRYAHVIEFSRHNAALELIEKAYDALKGSIENNEVALFNATNRGAQRFLISEIERYKVTLADIKKFREGL